MWRTRRNVSYELERIARRNETKHFRTEKMRNHDQGIKTRPF